MFQLSGFYCRVPLNGPSRVSRRSFELSGVQGLEGIRRVYLKAKRNHFFVFYCVLVIYTGLKGVLSVVEGSMGTLGT